MKIYYIRHGEPTYDKNDSLTDFGVYQVNEISKYLSQIPFDFAYTSPVLRTKRSAEPTLKKLNLKSEELEFASEDFAWFRLNGKNENNENRWLFVLPQYVSVFHKYLDKTNQDFFNDDLIKNTSFELIQNRVDLGLDNWLLSLCIKHDRKNKKYDCQNKKADKVILFAHQGISTFIFSSLLDECYPKFVIEHSLIDCASINIFDIDEENGKIALETYNKIVY